jgi:hypothetical protein
MSASTVRRWKSERTDDGVATTAEYVLLAGVAAVIFIALVAALAAFTATARDDATAIAAYHVISVISSAACEAAGAGDAESDLSIDLPGQICGMPYIVYPWPGGHNITICVCSGPNMLKYSAPVPIRASGVSLSGFITSPPASHKITYSPATRTVTLA